MTRLGTQVCGRFPLSFLFLPHAFEMTESHRAKGTWSAKRSARTVRTAF